MKAALLLAAALLLPLPGLAQTVGIGPETGLPLPRFQSLQFNKVNLRRGPGETYPIAWTYLRRGLPVEVFQEYEDWRHVRDHDGATGWIKRTQLSLGRSGLVQGTRAALHAEPEDGSRIVARAEPGVVFTLIACELEWCRAKAQGYRGWVRKTGLWGVADAETFGE